MKNILISLFILIPPITKAQQDSSAISLPIKNRIVFYEKEYRLDNYMSKDGRYDRALLWLAGAFPDSKEALKVSDKNAGKIVGAGVFKVIINDSGDLYWVKFVVAITVTDGACTFQTYNFYEKPNFKGVTNDYSKVEYRWRDFQKGKPWSSGDHRLFEGLDENVRVLMASLEKDMNK